MNAIEIASPIGRLFVAEDGQGICALRLMGRGEETPGGEKTPLLEAAEAELHAYFCGARQRFDLPLALCGTEFERAVWQALMEIPYGQTRTYGEIAAKLGRPKGARAVGGACSRNPVLVFVPCHRVIASSGALTGFAAGMQAKRMLLALEGHAIKGDIIGK